MPLITKDQPRTVIEMKLGMRKLRVFVDGLKNLKPATHTEMNAKCIVVVQFDQNIFTPP